MDSSTYNSLKHLLYKEYLENNFNFWDIDKTKPINLATTYSSQVSLGTQNICCWSHIAHPQSTGSATLSTNDFIQFSHPSYLTKTSYNNYVKYEFRGLTRTSYIPKNKNYTLSSTEQLVVYWKESDDDDANYYYHKYVSGDVLSTTFDLYDTTSSYYIGETLSAGYGIILSGTLAVDTITSSLTGSRTLSELTLAKVTLDQNSYAYWITNTIKQEPVVNLFNPTLATTTLNGVTCTKNSDGTYTLSGTATADTTFNLVSSFSYTLSSDCKLVGCPSTGGNSTWSLVAGTSNVSISDYGSGNTISSSSTLSSVYIYVANGAVCSNVVFKPMITTDLTATYSDFVKYSDDTSEVTDNYILFDSTTETEYTLKDNEYFLYTDLGMTQLNILGSGTKITRSSTSTKTWKCKVIDYSNIVSDGVSAIDTDSWVKLPSSVDVQEMEFFTLSAGDSLRITSSNSPITAYITPDGLYSTSTYSTSVVSGSTVTYSNPISSSSYSNYTFEYHLTDGTSDILYCDSSWTIKSGFLLNLTTWGNETCQQLTFTSTNGQLITSMPSSNSVTLLLNSGCKIYGDKEVTLSDTREITCSQLGKIYGYTNSSITATNCTTSISNNNHIVCKVSSAGVISKIEITNFKIPVDYGNNIYLLVDYKMNTSELTLNSNTSSRLYSSLGTNDYAVSPLSKNLMTCSYPNNMSNVSSCHCYSMFPLSSFGPSQATQAGISLEISCANNIPKDMVFEICSAYVVKLKYTDDNGSVPTAPTYQSSEEYRNNYCKAYLLNQILSETNDLGDYLISSPYTTGFYALCDDKSGCNPLETQTYYNLFADWSFSKIGDISVTIM